MHTPVLYRKMSLLSNRKFLSSGTRHNEVTRDWQNVIVFIIMGVHYIGVLFHTFYYYYTVGWKYCSLYWNLLNIGFVKYRGSTYAVAS